MKPVGLRELKARLSYYVRQVRTGRHLLVTDRGEVVAELAPPGLQSTNGARTPAALTALARKGAVILASQGHRTYPDLPLALRRHSSIELLDAERGAR